MVRVMLDPSQACLTDAPGGPARQTGAWAPTPSRRPSSTRCAPPAASRPRTRPCSLIGAAGGDPARLRELVERRSTGEPLAWLIGLGAVLRRDRARAPGRLRAPLADRADGDRGGGPAARRRAAPSTCAPAPAPSPSCSPAAGPVPGSWPPRSIRGPRRAPGPTASTCSRVTWPLPCPTISAGRSTWSPPSSPMCRPTSCGCSPAMSLAHEPRAALDGGADGTDLLRPRRHRGGADLLRPGGSLLLELGGDQADLLEPTLARPRLRR